MKKQFDLVVHKRDKKGKIVAVNPYRLLCRGGKKMYERPPHSGNFYSANGDLIQAGPELQKVLEEGKKSEAATKADLAELAKQMEDIKKEPAQSKGKN